MNVQANRDKIGAKIRAKWQDPVWRAARAEKERLNPRKRICTPHHETIRQLAESGVSMYQIAAQVGVGHKCIADYIRLHQMTYTYVHHVGKNNTSWNGGRHLDKTGYVLIHKPDHPNARNGYVREHRLVMEETLGRYLTSDEVVHHRDNDKQNNDPSNLFLFETNGAHLAETLKGQCPKWTEDGKARISAAVRQQHRRKAEAIRAARETGAASSPE